MKSEDCCMEAQTCRIYEAHIVPPFTKEIVLTVYATDILSAIAKAKELVNTYPENVEVVNVFERRYAPGSYRF